MGLHLNCQLRAPRRHGRVLHGEGALVPGQREVHQVEVVESAPQVVRRAARGDRAAAQLPGALPARGDQGAKGRAALRPARHG